MEKPILIVDIGCNHKGDTELAFRMSDTFISYGANVIKFQKRTPKELLSKNEYNNPHPNPKNSYGTTYGEHREFLELDISVHKRLRDYIKTKGALYSCSVWDITSAKEIISINPDIIKVPSAMNQNYELLKYILENFDKEIHISLGMTTFKGINLILDFLQCHSCSGNVVLYHCISDYPVEYKDTCLKEIEHLQLLINPEKHKFIKGFGFSGHHQGVDIDIAAYALGASYIERHVTFDKDWKGTDHSVSLLPKEVKKLKTGLIHTHEALKLKSGHGILSCEKQHFKKLKKIAWEI